ncbi:MAG: DUF488 family protein [Streptosporangiales bacterium]|nr:DUF488 family protein [Streptosporangiales bacterium]
MAEIEVQRVYDTGPRRGKVFLVDRVWPRGLRKDDLALDGWLRDLAPSSELRKWFGHRPERWEEFRERYHRELDGAGDALLPLFDAARRGPVTLLYSARDDKHNNAVALRDYVLERIRP